MVTVRVDPVLPISELNKNSNMSIIFIYQYTYFVYLNMSYFVPTGNGFSDGDAKYFADSLSVSG